MLMTLLLLAAAPTPVSMPRTWSDSLSTPQGAYRLWVALPRSYELEKKSYPIVYVLDADYAFGIVRNVAEHLADRDGLPELIIVGVGYPEGIEGPDWLRRYRLNRTRDYTPTQSPNGYPDGVQEVSGGGAAFLSVLEKKVMPFVEAKFRAKADQRAIIGHSYGGLFGAYAMLSRPGLFSRAVLISPSLWYDKRFAFRMLAEHPETLASARIFLAAGSKENVESSGDIAGDVVRFTQAIKSAVPTCDVGVTVFPDESHDTIFPSAVTRGLRAVFH